MAAERGAWPMRLEAVRQEVYSGESQAEFVKQFGDCERICVVGCVTICWVVVVGG